MLEGEGGMESEGREGKRDALRDVLRGGNGRNVVLTCLKRHNCDA